MAARKCAHCGDPISPERPAHTRFCKDLCRTKATQRRRKGLPEDYAPVVRLHTGADAPGTPEDQGEARGPVYKATLAELQRGSRVDTPLGQAALALASRLDLSRDSGSAMAALAKQLSDSLSEAMRGIAPKPDEVDEVRRRRDEKLRGA